MNGQNWIALGLFVFIFALGLASIPLHERLERKREERERNMAHRRKR